MNPLQSLMRNLGTTTKDTNLKLVSMRVQSAVEIERMCRVTNPEALKASPLKEVRALAKPPKYNLFVTFSQASEGFIYSTLPLATSCLTPMLEEAPGYTYTRVEF
jgi:hypothetical protein